MKKVAFPAIAMSLVLLGGCATITNGRFQQVTVQTQPPGADCMLSNDKGEWEVNSTPGIVQVHRSLNYLKVACHKTGYQTATTSAGSNVKKMMVGNVLFGGVIGAGIDTADGSGFSYPNVINLNLQPNGAVVAKKAKAKVKKVSK